jgi:ATP-dependent exoDNAse (exonuclease V) beta subunit
MTPRTPPSLRLVRSPERGSPTGTRELEDAAQREQIVSALDRNVLIEAAAGTGKTTELVNRIVAVLARGRTTVDRIVAMTFTEKAAGEIKLRIRSGLELARKNAPGDGDEYARLEHAIAHLEEAWVGTIHGFCAEILRERAVEAAVDPAFQVLTERHSEEMFARAFRGWFERVLENPPPGIRRSLRRKTQRRGEGPIERLRVAAWRLSEWRDLDARWSQEPFNRDAELGTVLERLHDLADLSAQPSDPKDLLYQDLEPARTLSRDLRAVEAAGLQDRDQVEAEIVALPRRTVAAKVTFAKARRGRTTRYSTTVDRSTILNAHGELIEAIESFARRANADLATLLQTELKGALEAYDAMKRRHGRLDFVDLLVRARDLVLRKDIRVEFQERFSHYFIDEFQDTDLLQAEILLLLVSADPTETRWEHVHARPGCLFVVGDPKQAIYRFRRADLGVYERVKEQLAGAGALTLRLTSSFRAVPDLQSAVNRAFVSRLDGDLDSQQAAYVPLTPVRPALERQPALIALPIPGTRGEQRINVDLLSNELPPAVGSFLDWLLHESGWTVTERDRTGPVPVEARHVCILFRRFSEEITRPYVAELDARRIRHLLVGGRSFHARSEVEAMRTALTAIEWPDDELSVLATLHGPLFAIDDEEILEYRHRYGRLHPFRLPGDSIPERLEPITGALGLLADLHRSRNARPVADTIHALLESTRAHAGFAFQPSGEQVLANVLHLTECARAHEKAGGLSFRSLVARLDADAASHAREEAPILEEGSEGVRLMTVHKAKGLEFPVVILADYTASMTWQNMERHVDSSRRLSALTLAACVPWELHQHQDTEQRRELAEAQRLTYVAATRARDLLVVPAVAEQRWGEGKQTADGKWLYMPWWLSPLNDAIYPQPGSRPEQPIGGPDFAAIQDPDGSAGGIAPGRYAMGGYGVVWWPTLRTERRRPVGVLHQELLDPAVDPALVKEDERRHREWEARRSGLIERASVPRILPVPATTRARGAPPSKVSERFEVAEHTLPRAPGRPTGIRFGSLVHAVLATIPLDADAPVISGTCTLQGRILGATDEEREAAENVTKAVLGSEILERARAAARSGRCRREVAITIEDDDGAIVEGQADLAFEENDRWTVVDFKTGADLDPTAEHHRRQVALYARAIEAATGRPARGWIVHI